MLKLYDDATVLLNDARSVSEYHFTPLMLQESSAMHIYYRMISLVDKKKHTLVLAGCGNNGADGIAVARMLFLDGFRVSIFAVSDKEGTPEYRKQREVAEKLGIQFTDDIQSDVYLDAMVGVGLKGRLRGRALELAQIINQSGKPVYAVDVPSGIGFESDGKGAVKADITFSLGVAKVSLYAPLTRENGGKIEVLAPLFPPSYAKEYARLYELADMKLPEIGSTEYKKTRGDLYIAGGSPEYAGAVLLSASSAFASGIGLVTVYTDPVLRQTLINDNPSIMVRAFSDFKADEKAVLLIGPGLGGENDEAVLPFFKTENRKVIDADGIRAFARLWEKGMLDGVKNAVFTPHPGELKALMKAVLKTEVPTCPAEYFAALKILARELSATIVVKSSVAIIANSEKISIVDLVNPSLAVAGSGDVLGAMIATLMVKCKDAPLEGVLFHKAAGEMARKEFGYYSSKQLVECAGRLR